MDNAGRRKQNGPGPLPGSWRKVLIVGLGRLTGTAVANALAGLGLQVRVAERDRSAPMLEAAQSLGRLGVEVTFDDADPALVEWADLVVPSPGVPPSNRLLQTAAALGTAIWSEIELGWRLARGPVLAITGTNGKTTTTELLTAMVGASRRAVSAGNIGFPLVRAASEQAPGTIFVTEVSSFQLAYIDDFRPVVGIVLNVADDHLDWHGDSGDYLRAKARITENQTPDDLLVVKASDPRALSIAGRSRARIGVFGTGPPHSIKEYAENELRRPVHVAAGLIGSALTVFSGRGEIKLMDTSDIRLRGPHNLENVLAAASAAFGLGDPPDRMEAAVREFNGLPHRMTLVAEKKGVKYIDDSKATNPHAALAALQGMKDVILIAGGRSKGISLDPLAAASPACKAVIVMGEASRELQDIFAELPVWAAGNVEEAVRKASDFAGPGDTVLLSPGCSSLDQYADYAERGDRFARAVLDLP